MLIAGLSGIRGYGLWELVIYFVEEGVSLYPGPPE